MLGGASVVAAPAPATNITLMMGDRGTEVENLQFALKLSGDGIFGPGTKRAVKVFQLNNGLSADGIAGPATLGKLYE